MQDDLLLHYFQDRKSPQDVPILPSRTLAFEQLSRAWVARQVRHSMLTGETGTGKSWLWRKAAEKARQMGENLRWIWVPQLPGTKGGELLRSLLIAMEDSFLTRSLSADRALARVERRIREFHEDGFRMEIVLEESHHLSREGFEVIRILQERLLARGVPLGVLYVGQSSLNYRFERISRHERPNGWHLTHVSLNETLELLRWATGSGRSWSRSEADWIHREALGNPRRIIRWAETWQPSTADPDRPMLKPGSGHDATGRSESGLGGTLWNEPLIPVRPPLAESEGVIEVGYDGSDESYESAIEIGEPADSNAAASGLHEIGSHFMEERAHDEHRFSSPTTRVWRESAEGFAPYGLGAPRQERMPDSES